MWTSRTVCQSALFISVIMEKPKYSHLHEYAAVFTATLVMFVGGTSLAWTSPTLPKLLEHDSPISINKEEAAWIVTVMLLGSLVSPILSTILVDKLGRKITLLISAIPFIIGWILILVADSVGILYASRCISGLGTGMTFAVMPMYLGEISPDEVRGSIGIIMIVMTRLGYLFTFSVAPYVSIHLFAEISLAFPIIFVAAFVWFPESPYFLLYNNRPDDAMSSLKQLRGHKNIKAELFEMYTTIQNDNIGHGKLTHLLKYSRNRKGIIIMCGLTFCQLFSGNAVINAYAETIFASAGGAIGGGESAIILGIVQLVSAIASSLFVDRLGRRPLLLISSCGTAITTAIVGAYFYLKDFSNSDVSSIYWIPIVAINMFFVFYFFGLATVPFTILGEIFPSNVKAIASSVTAVFASPLGFGASKAFQAVTSIFSSYVALWLFTACIILGSIFIYLFVPETKKISLVKVQADLYKQVEEV